VAEGPASLQLEAGSYVVNFSKVLLLDISDVFEYPSETRCRFGTHGPRSKKVHCDFILWVLMEMHPLLGHNRLRASVDYLDSIHSGANLTLLDSPIITEFHCIHRDGARC
jgi:hypothetical protein